MSGLAPNLKETLEENKALHEELRELQLKQDVGQTIGPDTRNPCKNELDALENCKKAKSKNSFLDCTDYSIHLKKCYEFWDAVQDYRVKYMNKSGLELPREEEFKKWQKQMPDWYIHNKLVIPEDI